MGLVRKYGTGTCTTVLVLQVHVRQTDDIYFGTLALFIVINQSDYFY